MCRQNMSSLRRSLLMHKTSHSSSKAQPSLSPVELCKFCSEQFKEMICKETEHKFRLTLVEVLAALSKNCFLCKIIADPNENKLYDEHGTVMITLTAHRSQIPEDNNRISRCVVRVGFPQYSLALWADSNDPFSDVFITRPPLSLRPTEHIYAWVQQLLDKCRMRHACFESSRALVEFLQGVKPPLPTRLLEITSRSGEMSVRLVETNGRRGRYCALSHCWGNIDQRPISTKRATLNDHLVGLPFDELPKTFREALMLTHGIGLRYLWIDSLCIIQDDEEDWSRESRNMGDIYRLADLVIAAAGSENSSGGLFVLKSPKQPPVDLSLASSSNPEISNWVVHALLLENVSDIPEHGPLAKRAWAFQEWYLARRVVFIMPGGITWTCNESELNEWGQPHTYTLQLERYSWIQLLEKYTAKRLTYPSDRVVALVGISKQMQDPSDPFDYGVVSPRLAEQLLWRVISKGVEQERIALPSWSWAATGGRKSWISAWWAGYPSKQYPTILAQDLHVSNDGSIKTSRSTIMPVDVTPKSIRKCCYAWLDYTCTSKQIHSYDIELELTSQFHWCPRKRIHIIGTATDARSTYGLACLDEEYAGRVYCWPLASQRRSRNSFFTLRHVHLLRSIGVMKAIPGQDYILEEEGETDSEEPQRYDAVNPPLPHFEPEPISVRNLNHEMVHFETPAGTMAGYVACDLDDDGSDSYQKGGCEVKNDVTDTPPHLCSEFWECAPSDHVVWALLLEKVGEARFRRVGLAMLYPKADSLDREDLLEFSII